jgi:hypothetical protein
MATGGVIINADNVGGENGDLNVNDVIAWDANTSLTLSAYRNLNLNAKITATGNTAGLTLNPGMGGAGGSYSLGASVNLPGSSPSVTISDTSYIVINNVTALQAINNNFSGNYVLGTNIDATATSGWNGGAGFVPVGNISTGFSGTFDGLGNTISNLVINQPATNSVGLFGYAATGSLVQNVGLLGGSVTGNNYVGGLVGTNTGTLSNVYTTGSVSGSGALVGSLIGTNYGAIINGYATGSVSGCNYGGGLVNTGAGCNYVGGLVGAAAGIVSNSYLTGSLVGSGSLVGFSYGSSNNWIILNADGSLVNAGTWAGSSTLTSEYTTIIVNAHQLQLATPTNGNNFVLSPSGVIFGTSSILDTGALATSATTAVDAASLGISPDMQVNAGWNLLGNSTDTPLNVATAMTDANMINSVWKWNPTTSNWAFYTPAQADGGAAYAASKGYELLTSINSGEGFWLNAKIPFVFALPIGNLLPAATAQTPPAPGWSMVSVGQNTTPSVFNTALSSTPPATGTIPTNLTSLWAWDNAQGNWFFYAPSLEAQGDTALADYNSSKGYRDFNATSKTLGPGMGFWVNKP